MEGAYHIYSVRDPEGQRVSTLGLKRDLALEQNLGEHNSAPPEKACEAGTWFAQAVRSGRLKVNELRGETEESKRANTAPAIVKAMGFWPTSEARAAAFKHYTNSAFESIVWDDKRKAFFSRPPRLIHSDAILPGGQQRHLTYDGRFARRILNKSPGEVHDDNGLDLWFRASGAQNALALLRREIWAEIPLRVPPQEQASHRL